MVFTSVGLGTAFDDGYGRASACPRQMHLQHIPRHQWEDNEFNSLRRWRCLVFALSIQDEVLSTSIRRNFVEKVSKRILHFLERRGVITLVTAPGNGEVTVVNDEAIGEEDPLLAKFLAAVTAGAVPAGAAKKRQPIRIAVDPATLPAESTSSRTWKSEIRLPADRTISFPTIVATSIRFSVDSSNRRPSRRARYFVRYAVAWSCKGRGFCPSCGNRLLAERHVDYVVEFERANASQIRSGIAVPFSAIFYGPVKKRSADSRLEGMDNYLIVQTEAMTEVRLLSRAAHE